MKYRELTREEAKDLFELGAPVESRHKYTYSFSGIAKDSVFDWESFDGPWRKWDAASVARLEETSHHLDEFRIAVE